MKILKMKLFQESACYKKPFAFKVAETYPLPPYSTVIGMFHKILQAKSGEYFPMNISIQGNYESIFNNYQTLRNYKGKEVTSMPRNVNQLLNVELLLHVKAEDDVIDRIYNNVINGKETFTLGRNEDLVRIDEIKILKDATKAKETDVKNYNAYIPNWYDGIIDGINYRLNTIYTIKDNLRKWEKTDVKYVERNCGDNIHLVFNALIDEDGDNIYFYRKDF